MGEWGLVLAGGGGKGSYQAGAWKFLCEQGYDKMFRAFSGTSVGALNAALFAQGDPAKVERVWRSITPDMVLTPKTLAAAEKESVQRGEKESSNSERRSKWEREIKRLEEKLREMQEAATAPILSRGDADVNLPTVHELSAWIANGASQIGTLSSLHSFALGAFSRNGLSQLIDDNIDLAHFADRMAPDRVLCYATCFAISKMKADYIELTQLNSNEKIRAYLLASSAIPVVFPAETVDETPYWDGGLEGEIGPLRFCGDNVPLRPIYEHTDIRDFLVIHLDGSRRLNEADFPGAHIVQMNPSKELGNFVTGTLNFFPASAARNIDQGYEDMKNTISQLL